MAERIYVVMGTTGEYSEREEWPVMGFYDEAQAERHAEEAAAHAYEFERIRAVRYVPLKDYPNPYDPHMHMVRETHYYVMEVPMATA